MGEAALRVDDQSGVKRGLNNQKLSKLSIAKQFQNAYFQQNTPFRNDVQKEM